MTFHPTVVPKKENKEIKFEQVKCNIKDSRPIYVTLIGQSYPPQEDQIKEIEFESIVRQPQQLEVEIPNPTDKKHCKIMANITTANKNWNGYF